MKKIIINEILDVPYKGNRDYVYASDLFKIILDKFVEHKIMDIEDIDYSIHSILKNKVSFSLFSLEEDEKIDEQADVRINFKSNNKKYVGLINENDFLITERTIYEENEIFINSTINESDSSIELNVTYSKYTNLDVFTSMNKRLLTEIRPDIKGKWLSVRLQLKNLSGLMEERNHYKVKLIKIFNNKYSRSYLFNDNKKIGNLYFSIN